MKFLKNEIILLVVVLLVLIAGTAGIAYYLQQNKQSEAETSSQKEEQESQEKTDEETPSSAKEELATERILEDEFYSIVIPPEWVQTVATSPRFLAIIIKPNDPAGLESSEYADYDSYYTVNNASMRADGLQEYVDILKQSLVEEVPTIEFTKQSNGTINGHEAVFIESDSATEGREYKTLLVIVDDGEWVWALSFNTPKASWPENKDLFYRVAESFEIKQGKVDENE